MRFKACLNCSACVCTYEKRGEKLVSKKSIIIASIIIIFCFIFYLFSSDSTKNLFNNADRVNNVRQSIVIDVGRLETSIGDVEKGELTIKEAIETNNRARAITREAKITNDIITSHVVECEKIIDRNINELTEVQSRFRANFPVDKERK